MINNHIDKMSISTALVITVISGLSYSYFLLHGLAHTLLYSLKVTCFLVQRVISMRSLTLIDIKAQLIHIKSYMVTLPDSIPPSDRHWPNVGTSVGPTLAADVGPTAF